ncbi:MAG: hypothetical protein OHM77_06845 [Candidatus Nitricoxidivorans perseverans]|uniref:Uncharacterized protein n=1 Tax=Candidatus Nitricoxidivorans perseverans TaxID=2975601 RepID=A0AA49FN83_9PROT|nr:MAG: hypothetical protein OHM77_06845 [Candidatus Nitricoxidivorans perseverans]
MKITSQDLHRLRWGIVFLAALLLTSAGIVFAATNHLKQARQEHRQAVARHDNIKSRLVRARDEEREIRAKISRYQELLARGIIGQERRLDWVERIARIQAARRLIDVQYELSPQQPVDAKLLPSGTDAGGYEFMASTMRLQMQLLHEDDLLGFLADLQKSIQALLIVRNCAVDRTGRGGTGERTPQAQLAAECALDWITLREKK